MNLHEARKIATIIPAPNIPQEIVEQLFARLSEEFPFSWKADYTGAGLKSTHSGGYDYICEGPTVIIKPKTQEGIEELKQMFSNGSEEEQKLESIILCGNQVICPEGVETIAEAIQKLEEERKAP